MTSRARKHVQEALLSNEAPSLGPGDEIVQVVEGKGNNVFVVLRPSTQLLDTDEKRRTNCHLPSKFRSLAWIKHGDFVIANLQDIHDEYGEIVHILSAAQVKIMSKTSDWPECFRKEEKESGYGDIYAGIDSDSDEDCLMENPNRRKYDDAGDDDAEDDSS